MNNVFNVSIQNYDLLWVGDTSTTDYSTQDVILDLHGYKLLNVVCRSSDSTKFVTNIVVNDSTLAIPQVLKSEFGATHVPYRFVTVTDTGLTFSDVYAAKTGELNSHNKNVIPYCIYGIR